MKRSEQLLLGFTVVAVVGYLVVEFGGVGSLFEGGSGGNVAALRSDYDGMADTLAEAPDVYRDFAEIVGTETAAPTNPEMVSRPDLNFQNEVTKWCRDAGFGAPDVNKSVEDIPDVDEYQMVLATVRIQDGDLARIAALLKTFESRGLILSEVQVRASRDSARLDSTITVGKLVETFSETRARRNRSRSTSASSNP